METTWHSPAEKTRDKGGPKCSFLPGAVFVSLFTKVNLSSWFKCFDSQSGFQNKCSVLMTGLISKHLTICKEKDCEMGNICSLKYRSWEHFCLNFDIFVFVLNAFLCYNMLFTLKSVLHFPSLRRPCGDKRQF